MSFHRFALAALLAFAPVVASADVKSEMMAAHAAMVEAGKFRMTGTVTSKEGTVPLWSEVQWPDRFHARNPGGEFIVLPGATYMKQGGQWMKMPMDMSAMIQSMTPGAIRQQFENMTNAKSLGEKTIDGETLVGYEYDTSATMMGIKAESHVQVWIDPDTKRIVRQTVDGKAMGQTSKTEQVYEYDDSISIDAPM